MEGSFFSNLGKLLFLAAVPRFGVAAPDWVVDVATEGDGVDFFGEPLVGRGLDLGSNGYLSLRVGDTFLPGLCKGRGGETDFLGLPGVWLPVLGIEPLTELAC